MIQCLGLKKIFVFFVFVLMPLSVYARTNASGIINFTVGHSPARRPSVQPVTLYGCHHTLISWDLVWGKENQVLKNVPYGVFKSKSGKVYGVSKYYIASPEVNRNQPDKKGFYIGLVTPDRFIFHGKKPAKIINLDYRILNPVDLVRIPVDFNYKYNHQSCAQQGVTLIPIDTRCRDFPWKNGALGGSGIGQLSIYPLSTAFLPLRQKSKEPLQCRVTILDDVMLNHQVFFATKNGKTKTINLTQYYRQSKPMQLICIARKAKDIPAGCIVQQHQ